MIEFYVFVGFQATAVTSDAEHFVLNNVDYLEILSDTLQGNFQDLNNSAIILQ